MIRMQVQFTDVQAQALKQRAARERVSVSVLVRRAVDGLTALERTAADQTARQRAITAVGRFASGQVDVAERHDAYLADAFSR